jgi:hypothetical protein
VLLRRLLTLGAQKNAAVVLCESGDYRCAGSTPAWQPVTAKLECSRWGVMVSGVLKSRAALIGRH